jgi:T4 bacteriophage base plate protein
MPFKLNAYLPSKKQEVQIKELCYKQYRELVKSLHNVDKKETVLQYNSILEDLCPEIAGKDITFEDKLSLLLTIRNYCVSPDLKLKCNLPDNSVYSFVVPVETIINKIVKINKSGSIIKDGITVTYSSYKIRDEHVFLSNNKDTFVDIASIIDTIKIQEQEIVFKDLSLSDRIDIVQTLPASVLKTVIETIESNNQQYESVELLTIKNPNTQESLLKISGNVTFVTLQKLVEFLFTESLNNIYKTLYNVVKHVGFTAEYTDSITPIEVQVYWMYLMQDMAKQQEQSNTTNPGGGFNLPNSTTNSELGF